MNVIVFSSKGLSLNELEQTEYSDLCEWKLFLLPQTELPVMGVQKAREKYIEVK